MNMRDAWHKSAIKSGDKLHWNAYHFFRQEVKREIRFAEREHVQSELRNTNGNTNSIWKIVNRVIPRKISSSLMTVEDSYALANNFNEFYTNSSLKGLSSCQRTQTNLPGYKSTSNKHQR